MSTHMSLLTTDQGHAEDVLQRHRFLYHVRGRPELSDASYDALERGMRTKWGVSIASHAVGSSQGGDYPAYAQG